jgi:hypothetical protein
MPGEADAQGWNAPGPGRGAPRQQQAPQATYPPQAEVPPYAQGMQADPYAVAPPPGTAQQAAYPYYAAPQYDPYAQAPGVPSQAQAQAYAAPGYAPSAGAAPAAFDQWPGPDRRALDLASYTPAGGAGLQAEFGAGRHAQHHFSPPQTTGDEWSVQGGFAHGAHHGLDAAHDPGAYPTRGGHGGLEQTYADDDGYETTEPRRGRRMLSVLASAVVIGGGLAYAYSSLIASRPDSAPPVVKSAEGPFKVKPSDPGGKQFAHSDSKIMGRLGEDAAGGDPASSPSSSSEVDATGARKVPVLVVGRDGSIQGPASAASSAPSSGAAAPTVSVPGMTVVDALGGGATRPGPIAASPEKPETNTPETKAARAAPAQEREEPVAAAAQSSAKKPVVVSKAVPTSSPDTTQSISDTRSEPGAATASPTKASATKTAAASATVAPSATPPRAAAPADTEPSAPAQSAAAATPAPDSSSGPSSSSVTGYVAVLASVPASANSRVEALKQFANMQEKYGALLQDKTPDVKEANLGAKGTYHRLLVGPPGSRDAANALCIQLKAQGYSDCWVTAY